MKAKHISGEEFEILPEDIEEIEFNGEKYDVGPEVIIIKSQEGETRLVHKNSFEDQFEVID